MQATRSSLQRSASCWMRPRRSGPAPPEPLTASPSSSCSPPPRSGTSESAGSTSRCSRWGWAGTWDATSVVSPAVAVITGVGLDHMGVLGDTVEEIAAEKAGIIRPASAPVLGPGTAGLEAVFLERAEHAHTHARAVREGAIAKPGLRGAHRALRRACAPDGARRSGRRRRARRARGLRGARRSPRRATRPPTLRPPSRRARRRSAARSIAPASQAALSRVALPGRFELVRVTPADRGRRLAQSAGGGRARGRDR